MLTAAENTAPLKAAFHSAEFFKRAETILLTRENPILKLNRNVKMSDILLYKIRAAREIPLTGKQL